MDSLQEIYTKYDKIIKYSAYAFTGWFLSWVLFFIMLPFMVRYYGKIRGASLNYGFSWFSMIAIILGLEFGLRRWKSLESGKYNPLNRTLFGHFSNLQTYKIQRISLNDFIAENISFEIWSPKIEDSVDWNVTPPVLGVQTQGFGGCMRFFCGNPGKMSILPFALETFETRIAKHRKMEVVTEMLTFSFFRRKTCWLTFFGE
jgi:uncharacterized protein with PQ loop repeat